MPRRKVPRKNIENRIVDVRYPHRFKAATKLSEEDVVVLEKIAYTEKDFREDRSIPKKKQRLRSRRFVLVIVIVIVIVAAAATGVYILGRERLDRAQSDMQELQGAMTRLTEMNGGASARLTRENQFGFTGATEQVAPSDPWSAIRALFGLPGDAGTFAKNALALVGEIENASAAWPDFIVGKKSAALMDDLALIRATLGSMEDAGKKLSSAHTMTGSAMSADAYLGVLLEIHRAHDFLDAFVPYLQSKTPHHLLVLLENPSELRPGGGFVGSYADVTLGEGRIMAIEVHDVNDAASASDKKIIPPKELQGVVTQWRAADANWFFDFSASAKKTIELVEASHLYKDPVPNPSSVAPHSDFRAKAPKPDEGVPQGTSRRDEGLAAENTGVRAGYGDSGQGPDKDITFDGALGVSARVVGDMLALTGPITLPSSTQAKAGPILTNDNFLSELQREVAMNERAKTKNPKQILGELAPVLFARVAALDAASQRSILSLVAEGFKNKSVRVYFKDAAFENFFDAYGATGKVFTPPANWNGDYLAVVAANAASGKSDIYMKQSVRLVSQIGADGTLRDRVHISRTHAAPKNAETWYTRPNESYIRVLAPLPSLLLDAAGGIQKKITPRANYMRDAYATDADLAALESSSSVQLPFQTVTLSQESGKQVFGMWMRTARGKTATSSVEYSHRLYAPPADGQVYEFVFEKQTGATGDYDFSISAPLGWRFRENKLPLYEYASSDPPARLTLNLTLEKI